MKFNKGAELDKQIYKEGEPTWGCKSGVLDVEDVKEWIEEIKEEFKLKWNDKGIGLGEFFDIIDKSAGDKSCTDICYKCEGKQTQEKD